MHSPRHIHAIAKRHCIDLSGVFDDYTRSPSNRTTCVHLSLRHLDKAHIREPGSNFGRNIIPFSLNSNGNFDIDENKAPRDFRGL
jgi:hypothetical protein